MTFQVLERVCLPEGIFRFTFLICLPLSIQPKIKGYSGALVWSLKKNLNNITKSVYQRITVVWFNHLEVIIDNHNFQNQQAGTVISFYNGLVVQASEKDDGRDAGEYRLK